MLFGGPLAVLVTLGDNAGGITFGGTPVSLLAVIMLFGVILRRTLVTPKAMSNLHLDPARSYAGSGVA
jgi:hypothetical protein